MYFFPISKATWKVGIWGPKSESQLLPAKKSTKGKTNDPFQHIISKNLISAKCALKRTLKSHQNPLFAFHRPDRHKMTQEEQGRPPTN